MATAPTAAAATEGTKSKAKTVTKASGTSSSSKAKKPAAARPRKKPPPKSSATSTNQATWNNARAAQMELANQRKSAADKMSDPLWYRVEDLLSSAPEETPMAEASSHKILPEQIQIVEQSLSHNHLTRVDVTPQAFCVLMEQARRFALEVLADAQDYALHAGRNEITKADLQLASDMRTDHPITASTQLAKLNLLAQQINRVPLPPIPSQCYSGVLLPPKHHQLTARTFDVVSGAQVAQKMVQEKPSMPSLSSSSKSKLGGKTSVPKPSYGAARGRQISIVLKEKEDGKDKEQKSTDKKKDDGPTPMNISSPGAKAASSAPTGEAAAGSTTASAPNAGPKP